MDPCNNICFCFILIFLFAIFFLEAKNHRRGKLRNGRQGTTTMNGSQKAIEMCDKYTRQACGASPPANSGARIVGGTKVFNNRFPHMATLGNPNGSSDWWCGASLISENYLLTAAHCFFDKNDTRIEINYVRMGDLNLKIHTDDQHVIIGKVIETVINPWYSRDSGSEFGDVALIKIEPINFTDWVRPICLNTKRPVPNVSLSITGWGDQKENGKQSHRLRVTEVYQVNFLLCTSQILNTYDDTTMMCAGVLMGGKDACLGDSGGPMQMPINKDLPYPCNVSIWSQVGIISTGEGCARPYKPTTYMRISYYIDWIASIVWKDT